VKALVTGGAGFIGSHLSQALVQEGVDVVILDDFSTGTKSNLENLAGNGAVSLIEGSILDEDLVRKLMSQVNSCFHLGAALGVQRILEKRYQSLKTNVTGSENVSFYF